MPWIKFERDYMFKPEKLHGHVAIAFKKGYVIFATREASSLAIARKAAREATEEEIENARRKT